ncbi:MAG: hypothetical protein ABW136_08975 [Steroidobacteraceae bacterium]
MASQGASLPSAAVLAAGPAPPAAATQAMDAAFIERNQIVERYLTGKLPPKGITDFERYCREHPELVDSLGLSDRINSALKLLDASGRPEPWAEKPRRFYERAVSFFAAAAVAIACVVTASVMSTRATEAERQVAVLEKQVGERPLLPTTSTRTITVEPSRTGPSQRPALTMENGSGEMVDLKIDVAWSKYTNYRVTLDRTDQGRVAIFGGLQRDSNGQLRIALNSSALGPGSYQLLIEGVDWRGGAEAQAWVTFAAVH